MWEERRGRSGDLLFREEGDLEICMNGRLWRQCRLVNTGMPTFTVKLQSILCRLELYVTKLKYAYLTIEYKYSRLGVHRFIEWENFPVFVICV